MRNFMAICLNKMALAAVVLLAAGCTTMVSYDVDDSGHAREVVFPKITKSAQNRAISPSFENLRKVSAGVSKNDLYYLLGAPHFNEAVGAREWDYVFKFYDTSSGYSSVEGKQAIVECQYKVIFDKEMKGQTFYWQPQTCEALAHRQ